MFGLISQQMYWLKKNAMYEVHMIHESYSWVRYKCGLPNFTDSTLFLNFDTFNSFEILKAREREHPGSPYRHTSSPNKFYSTSSKHRRPKILPNSTCKPKSIKRPLKILNINLKVSVTKFLCFILS